MVTRSRAREGRGISVDPEVEFRLETEVRPEKEIPVSTSALCERESSAARSYLSDVVGPCITADRPGNAGRHTCRWYGNKSQFSFPHGKPHFRHRHSRRVKKTLPLSTHYSHKRRCGGLALPPNVGAPAL